MSREAVFLDTVGLLALCIRSDQWHKSALDIEQMLTGSRTPLVVSDWVLAELLNGAASFRLREPASRVVKRLQSSPRATIVEASRTGWLEAFELYNARPDKDWSFVDCSSILICQARGIRRVFTHDRHFQQAGFEVLLR